MKTLRSSRILALLLLVSAAFIGANAANQNSGAAQPAAKGAYTVTFHVNMPTTVPDGATISCKASIAPQPTVFEHFTRRHTATAQSTTGFANVANNSATCTVAAPFAFKVADPLAGAAISYEIEAYTSTGPVFARRQQGIPVAYPQPGSTSSLPLDVNF
jgi:hypothetical protein